MSLPPATPPAQHAPENHAHTTAVAGNRPAGHYTVREGDSLWSIAHHLWGHGSRWPLLWKANPGLRRHPNAIRPGDRLAVPADPPMARSLVNAAYAAATPAVPAAASAAPVAAAPPAAAGDGDHDGDDPPGFSTAPGSFAASTHAAIHHYACGDGDGDGYDMPCWKLHRHTATTPAAPAAQSPVVYSAPAAGGVWGCIAQHESGNTNADTGNGFYGYFQFTAATWQSISGLGGVASDYSYGTQLAMAEKLQATSGWGNWPVTSVACGVG